MSPDITKYPQWLWGEGVVCGMLEKLPLIENHYLKRTEVYDNIKQCNSNKNNGNQKLQEIHKAG